MAGTGRTTSRKSGGNHTLTDPTKKSSYKSTSNTDPKNKRTHTMKSKSGGNLDIKKKTVEDAKAGRGAFKKPVEYKGKTIKNSSGKMSGYKTHDGKYTRVTNTVDRKKAEKKIAYDKKLQAARAKDKANRNKRFAEAKLRGSDKKKS